MKVEVELKAYVSPEVKPPKGCLYGSWWVKLCYRCFNSSSVVQFSDYVQEQEHTIISAVNAHVVCVLVNLRNIQRLSWWSIVWPTLAFDQPRPLKFTITLYYQSKFMLGKQSLQVSNIYHKSCYWRWKFFPYCQVNIWFVTWSSDDVIITAEAGKSLMLIVLFCFRGVWGIVGLHNLSCLCGRGLFWQATWSHWRVSNILQVVKSVDTIDYSWALLCSLVSIINHITTN